MRFPPEISLEDAKRLLGLDGPVTAEAVRAAYRRAAQSAHPDHGGSAAAFKAVHDAYTVLSAMRPSVWAGCSPFKPEAKTGSIMTETQFVRDIVTALEHMGALTFKVHGHAMQAAGWPDLQVYHPRWTGHIEAKVGNNTCSALQKIRIKDLRRLGTKAVVLRWLDGMVRAEDENAVELARVNPQQWSQRQGNIRGNALLELLEIALTV